MNESEIIDKLSCLVCYPIQIPIANVPIYFARNKTKTPWEKKVDLLLYPQALILRNSNGFRDYLYGLIRWQDLKSITVESQGSINLFLLILGLLFGFSYLMLFLTTQIIFTSPDIFANSSFLLIGALFSSVSTGIISMLSLPKYCLHLKTNSELYVFTIKDSGDFNKIKSFAEKVVEQVEQNL